MLDWDAEVDWARYPRVVPRSTWDYAERLTEFRDWLDRVDGLTELCNPLPLLRWNMDKRYLTELADAGVPTVPTTAVPPGSDPALPTVDFVLKPSVGAGSRGVGGYTAAEHDAARTHLRRLHDRGQTVLIQPLLRSVATDGEWPLMFLGGRYSHAASKRITLADAGLLDELFAGETLAAHTANPAQLDVAQRAIDVVTARFGTPAYARVDLVAADDGGYQVLELEVIEPSLFLTQADPAAADRLVAALTAP